MYTVGSIADLISGTNTPNKQTVELKEVEKTPLKTKNTPVTPKGNVASGRKKNGTPTSKKFVAKTPSKTINTPVVTPKGNAVSGGKKSGTPTSKKFVAKTPQKPKTPLVAGKQIEDMLEESSEEDEDEVEDEEVSTTESESDSPKKRTVKLSSKPSKLELNKQTIFVGNVAMGTKKGEICKFFSKFGKILSVRFNPIGLTKFKLPTTAAFVSKKISDKISTTNCLIVFKKEEYAKESLKANGKLFRSKHLRVDLYVDSEKQDPKKGIFVGNLAFNAEDEHLWEIFNQFGAVHSVRIVRDNRTGMGKGFGYVNFESADTVELVLPMKDLELNKRKLRMERAKGNPSEKKRDAKGKKNRKKIYMKSKLAKKPGNKDNNTNENKTEVVMNKNTEESKEMPKKHKIPKNKKNKAGSPKQNFQGVKVTPQKKKKKMTMAKKQLKKRVKMLAPKNATQKK